MNLPRPLSAKSRRTSLFRLPLAGVLAAGLVATAAISGCGEEPPPPPPPKKEPPPPPPPPPPEISVQALLQEMKADARVTFADSVKITDESLARAVISLADGFARGDASKLRPVLSDSGQSVLGGLDASGDWTAATSGIEAVRVVYVGDAGDAFTAQTAADSGPNLGNIDFSQMKGDFLDAFKGIPRDALNKALPVFSKYKDYIDKEGKVDFEKFQKDLEAAGIDQANALKIKGAMSAMTNQAVLDAMGATKDPSSVGDGSGSGPASANYTHAVVLAVQDAKGAFLLGWGIGDMSGGVRFGNAPTAPITKPRASDFDNVGLAAFGTGVAASEAAAPEEKPAEKKADDPNALPPGAPGANEPPPPNPRRKSTPGGPVNVPGSG